MTSAPRCPRCGESVRKSQDTCAVCGAALNLPAASQLPLTLPARRRADHRDGLGSSDHFSAMFLAPPEMPLPPLHEDRFGARDKDRLMIWFALGLAAVSLLGGILYYFYYLQVGNRVTAMLPRETVAYVRIQSPSRLEEAFTNLSLWQTTRPIRDRLSAQEQRLLAGVLLDIGINRALLDELLAGLHYLHIAALLPERQVPEGVPYDLVFFLEFSNPDTRRSFLRKISRFFESAGQVDGISYSMRRMDRGALSIAQIDDMIVLCLGSDATLLEILANRERGPNRSLNDAPGFRKAYRDHGHEDRMDIFAYARHDHLIDLVTHDLLGPTLTDEQRLALAPYGLALRSAPLDGAGLAIDLAAGQDGGQLRFYASGSNTFSDLSEQTGFRPMATLTAIPNTAVLTLAGSLDDPAALFAHWRGPFLELLTRFGFFGPGGNPDPDLNRLQAESGVYLKDLLKNLAREMAVAYLPTPDSADLTWLLVFRVHSQDRALEATSRLARHVYPEGSGATFRPRYPFDYHGGLHRIRQVRDIADGTTQSRDVLCWAAESTLLILAPTCDAVRSALKAQKTGQGMDQKAQTALATLPETSTVVVLGRLHTILTRLLGPRPALDLIRRDFIAAAAFGIYPDRLEMAANVSALSLSFLWATATDARPQEDSDACDRLVTEICKPSAPLDPDCVAWKAKIAGSSREACTTGLRTMRSFEAP